MSKKAIERWVKNIHQEARDGEKSYPQEFNIIALQKISCKMQLFWRFFASSKDEFNHAWSYNF